MRNLYDCFDIDKICITANQEYQYTNIETKECFKTKEDCLQKGGKEKCRYFDSCDPSKDYMFNNICYKNNCPQGTILDPLNHSSRNCICKEDFEIDQITGLITCIETYPEEYYSNKDQCPYIYKGRCVSECPENTCLNPNLKDLINCVDIADNIKVYNGICIEGIEEMIANIIDSDNFTNIKLIQTPSGTTINTYPTEITMDTFENNYPNLTYVDLGDCENKLKIHYNLDNETKLYILGINSPNLYGTSSINIFNFEIYLKNGTQLKDLSACNETKIITSSYINNLNIIKFESAKKFSNDGYDIYNKTDKFYTDNCAPANDNGNDITLEDRKTYYYPNISICNEGCDYNSIDFETQRFVCECNINLTPVNDNNENEENKEDDESYLEYFLSLINYKIIKCFHLINEYQNYYYNAGIYIGLATLIISIILIFVFCIKTIDSIKIELLKNMPTKEKLEEIYRLNRKHKTVKNEESNNNINIVNIQNPPRKIKKSNTIKLSAFDNDKNKKTENEGFKRDSKNENNSKIIELNNEIKYEKIESRNNKKIKSTRLKEKKDVKILRNINKNQKQEKEENSTYIKLESPTLNHRFNKNNQVENISLSDKNKSSLIQRDSESEVINNNVNKDKVEDNSEFNIDLYFSHLIDIKDEEIDKRELNEISYGQALRIDKRNFFEIALAVIINKIGILNLFFYKSPYSYLSLNITVYLFEFLLDLTMNCFLYSDDVVSEKYHNDGSLSIITSFTLSIFSNIISSIFTSIISNLTDYSELMEAIIVNVKLQKKYVENIVRFLKYIRIRLTIFYILEIIFILLMTYYLFIFCTVYHHSQISILINYIIGALTSLAISVGLTLIISILRYISIKFHSNKLFNTSRFLYKKF